MSSQDPPGPRGRLSRSGRFLPLVKPVTIAPPTGEFDQDDAYAEVSIERHPILDETPVPEGTGEDDEDDDALTPPR